jgi:hypothetical protein
VPLIHISSFPNKSGSSPQRWDAKLARLRATARSAVRRQGALPIVLRLQAGRHNHLGPRNCQQVRDLEPFHVSWEPDHSFWPCRRGITVGGGEQRGECELPTKATRRRGRILCPKVPIDSCELFSTSPHSSLTLFRKGEKPTLFPAWPRRLAPMMPVILSQAHL